jgi:lysophospholipase L1-like esterase
MPLLLFVALLLAAALLFLLWGEKRLYRPDARYPRAEAATSGKTRLVCAGDSITHGNVSASYVELLAQNHPDWQVFNAGINSDLAETLLRRLGDVVSVNPDLVTVLIGTNDVNATMSRASLLSYRRHGKTAGTPDADQYRRNLTTIVRRLKAETSARIALLSLPPMGEDLTHEANRRADAYSDVIREIADAEGVAYLPLRERMKADLEANPSKPRIRFEETVSTVFVAAVLRHVFGWDFDRIAARYGNRLLTDNLHLNSRGAALVAEVVEAEFLKKKRNEKQEMKSEK